MNPIGEKIIELRKIKGWTQDDLAEAADLHRVTIAKYELGKTEPKAKSLEKLAKALDVDASVILGNSITDEEKEIWELREKLRRDPERHILFSLAKDASIDDVRRAVAIIDALKQTRR